ncbi:MAG: head GIN domain-containing protein [Bacteroidota bacterium]
MKNIFLFSLLCAFSLCACFGPRVRGNGTIKTDTREMPAFESIVCDGGYEVHITCQAQQSVSIQSDENILPFVKTEVSGDRLRIYTKGNLAPTQGIQITVSVPRLEEFTVNGSAEGDVQKILSDSFTLAINGSSRMNLSGSADELKIHISGSAKINADSLAAKGVKAHIEGSGTIYCQAANSIDARIDGSGKIKYHGEPKTVNQSINGSGSVEKE